MKLISSQVFSEEESNLNVAIGYLSVLLGFLCLNSEVRAWVGGQLYQGSFKQLVNALEEFLQFYREAGQGVFQGDGRESAGGYVCRLQGLVEDLKR